MQKIKMIVCDIDGTLVQDYEQGFDPRLFDQIRAFLAAGVKFTVATGRQYPNLAHIFKPFINDAYMISENGSCIFFKDELLEAAAMPMPDVYALIDAITAVPDCEPMISAPRFGYYSHPSASFQANLARLSGFVMHEVADFRDIVPPVVKVTAFVSTDSAAPVPYLTEPWSKKFNMAIAGEHWLDFNPSNKGEAVAKLATRLNLTPDEVLIFGDNFNDIEMLKFTKNSFAMPHSAPPVIAAAGLGVCDNIGDYLAELLKNRCCLKTSK